MRLISQDGTIDMPYELSVIWISEKNGYSVKANMPNDEAVLLGMYSSREKALRAMEMLRETYIGMPIVMQKVDVSEDVVKEFERLKKCGIMLQIENQPSKVDFINNAIFQFPQDDEIEV